MERRKFSVFVGESRGEKKRDREGFSEILEEWAWKEVTLYGSTGMRVENKDQVGDGNEWDECGRFVIGMWLFLHVEMSGLNQFVLVFWIPIRLQDVWDSVFGYRLGFLPIGIRFSSLDLSSCWLVLLGFWILICLLVDWDWCLDCIGLLFFCSNPSEALNFPLWYLRLMNFLWTIFLIFQIWKLILRYGRKRNNIGSLRESLEDTTHLQKYIMLLLINVQY